MSWIFFFLEEIISWLLESLYLHRLKHFPQLYKLGPYLQSHRVKIHFRLLWFTLTDFFFWRNPRRKEQSEEQGMLPWLTWFIWKSWDKKVFEGAYSEPLDILHLAESEFWRGRKPNSVYPVQEKPTNQWHNNPLMLDVKWFVEGVISDLEAWLVLLSGEHIVIISTRGQRRCLSPLQSQMDVLLWVMSCILNKGF